ncbi:MAG TPA: TMEM175 family protein [Rhodanobacteraceae bacterium]
MKTARMEAFTDGVMAVALTIMVLELRPPHTAEWQALLTQWPVALSYILSFIYIGLYWNNHHHLMLTTERIDGRILWANLHWLFWVTLVPFATAWLSESRFASVPAALYGVVLLMTGVAFLLMQRAIIVLNGADSLTRKALGARDVKGASSLVLYLVALAVVAWLPWISCVLYAAVAAIWFVPDRRFEKVVTR